MKAIVSGAAGFIGAHLVSELIKRGVQVRAFDNYNDYYSSELKENRVSNLINDNSGAKIFKASLLETSQLDDLFTEFEPDTVIHLAAQAGVRLPAANYVDSNILGFLRITELVEKYEVSNFIYASSSSVYGDLATLPYTEVEPNLKPNSFYGLTKLLNENYARILSERSGIKSRGLRLFTVYGSWGRPDMAYFRLVNSALHSTPFRLSGTGEVKRDFTHISDVSRVIYLLSEELNERPTGYADVVNLGGKRPISMLQLVREIEDVLDCSIKIDFIPSDKSDVMETNSENRYLNTLLGKQEFLPFETGIKDFITWAKMPSVYNKLPTWVNSSK